MTDGEAERLDFPWEGSDECDEASGRGWLQLEDENHLKGAIQIHHGDRSTLLAKRA
ncbi:hypothetical protein [Leptolyngbya sp. PCC 6406]|uniref:hypothetical protein n=1 Tax=Leptolyngbya sp. PCC 6406 TaxID=1173264 RepID=UPI0003052FD0|nr:hypothetical protein [Leptolyngbya sp. PCC 6406]